MKIVLKNKYNGQHRVVPLGYSFTFAIFGVFVPVIRRDWAFAALIAVISFLMGNFVSTFSVIVFNIVLAFFYNKMYANNALLNGFQPQLQEDFDYLQKKGYKVFK